MLDFVHPELLPGEVYYCNDTEGAFHYHGLKWKTARMGKTAYTTNHEPLGRHTCLHPIFVMKSELDAAGVKYRCP